MKKAFADISIPSLSSRSIKALSLLVMCILCSAFVLASDDMPGTDKPVFLIIRGDDMGSCHGANVAIMQCYRDGIMKSTEIMVPTPWYREAVGMLKEAPGLDVGVHLTLNAEWKGYKWGAVTGGASLMDVDGCFDVRFEGRHKPTPERPLSKLDEIERELEAQIRIAKRDIPQLSHITCHMRFDLANPQLRDMIARLSRKYDLPVGARLKNAGQLGGKDTSPRQKVDRMLDIISSLQPGVWIQIEHPGINSPELAAISSGAAKDRPGVTAAWTSPEVKKGIQQRNIQLISYADLYQIEITKSPDQHSKGDDLYEQD